MQAFCMKNVTISNTISLQVLVSDSTMPKYLQNVCFYCIFALSKGNKGSAQADVKWRHGE